MKNAAPSGNAGNFGHLWPGCLSRKSMQQQTRWAASAPKAFKCFAGLFRHVRFDDRLALGRQLVQLLGEAFDDAAAAGLHARTILLEVGLARGALGRRLSHGIAREKRGYGEENAWCGPHHNPPQYGMRAAAGFR